MFVGPLDEPGGDVDVIAIFLWKLLPFARLAVRECSDWGVAVVSTMPYQVASLARVVLSMTNLKAALAGDLFPFVVGRGCCVGYVSRYERGFSLGDRNVNLEFLVESVFLWTSFEFVISLASCAPLSLIILSCRIQL
jgi:hypothetical protein